MISWLTPCALLGLTGASINGMWDFCSFSLTRCVCRCKSTHDLRFGSMLIASNLQRVTSDTSHIYKQQNINMTHGAHRGAYRGRFKDAKKATFHDQVCGFFIISKNKLHSFVSQRLNAHSCTTTLARSLHAWWLLHPLLHQCTRSGSFRRKTTKGE